MEHPTLSLCMIVRDVSGYIESCLDSVIDVCDEVIITDTGSADNTLDVLEKYLRASGKKYQILEYTPRTHPESFIRDDDELGSRLQIPGPYSREWILGDFGGARQFGWEKASGDYQMWLDSDDLVKDAQNIPETLEVLRNENLAAVMADYEYAKNEAGQVICKLRRERIVKRGAGAWKCPIHEIIVVSGPSKIVDTWEVTHRRNEIRKTQKPKIELRNLKVLLSCYEKEKKTKKHIDPRLLFYTGMEMRGLSNERAEPIILEYLKRSDWDEERSVAWYWLGEIAEARGDHLIAFERYAAAAVEFPSRPEGLFGCARTFYYRALSKLKDGLGPLLDWRKCTELTERGYESMRTLWPKLGLLQHNPTERLYRPLIHVSKAYIDSGRVKEGMEAAEAALRINPNNHEMQTNVRICREWFLQKEREKTPPTEVMPEPTNMDGPDIKALEKTTKFPPGSEGSARPSDPKNEKTTEIELSGQAHDIVFWTGSAWETWSPRSLDTGIGGSETAVIHLARHLHRLGHRVRVLSDCKHLAGVYDGVEYIHFEEARTCGQQSGNIECDVLVISRQLGAVDLPIEAKVKILWVHDIHVGPYDASFERRILKIDKIFCLSKWHRDESLRKVYPCLPFDRYEVTRNGIDPYRFKDKPINKVGQKLVYSSSGNRGLDRLLDLFPRIRQAVKEAELHVYYGFETWKAMARMYRNEREIATIEALERKMRETEGVFSHGRVGQNELAQAFLEAKVWAYPTSFTETSCITALEAQAAGCVPVTTSLAALPETVKSGFLIPPMKKEAYDDIFVENVVRLLTNEEARQKIAILGREKALSTENHWATIASEWVKIFREELAKNDILPPYFIEMAEAPRTVLG